MFKTQKEEPLIQCSRTLYRTVSADMLEDRLIEYYEKCGRPPISVLDIKENGKEVGHVYLWHHPKNTLTVMTVKLQTIRQAMHAVMHASKIAQDRGLTGVRMFLKPRPLVFEKLDATQLMALAMMASGGLSEPDGKLVKYMVR